MLVGLARGPQQQLVQSSGLHLQCF
jgi:hypothetical protein